MSIRTCTRRRTGGALLTAVACVGAWTAVRPAQEAAASPIDPVAPAKATRARAPAPGPTDRLSAADMVSLRAVQQIARDQVGHLNSDVTACLQAPPRRQGAARMRSVDRCLFTPLVHVATTSRLNAGIVSSLGGDLVAGPCSRRIGRYAAVLDMLGALAADAVQTRFEAPGHLQTSARAYARVAVDAVTAADDRGWHTDCAPAPAPAEPHRGYPTA